MWYSTMVLLPPSQYEHSGSKRHCTHKIERNLYKSHSDSFSIGRLKKSLEEDEEEEEEKSKV